jgi:hypothetical protein
MKFRYIRKLNNYLIQASMKDSALYKSKGILSTVAVLFLSAVFQNVCKGDELTDRPIIFPLPQEIELTNASFVLDENVTVIVPVNASPRDMSLARSLVGELSARYSLAVKIEKGSVIPSGRKVIVMGAITNPLIKKFCLDNKIQITSAKSGPEGYFLQTGDKQVIVAGWDEPGAFYGFQSLRQLIREGKGKVVRGVRVTDWPDMSFRGIRLYVPGPENIAYFKRFMKDFMALYKYNKLIMEVNCMRLDRHPEVNAGWIEFSKYMQYTRSNSTQGIHGEEKNSSHYDAGDGYILEKDDIRGIVDYAGQNFIEVIPEIPSLTHGYYLLTRHPELAEYPGDKWPDTYCPSNPASYDLMFDVYDEYLDVIKPKMVHIGHDEWWGAPIGVCPRCKGKDHSLLFAGDIKKIHSYFAGKGIKVAMWGDYLLESVRDTLVQDWVSSTGLKYQTPGAVRPEVVKESIPKDILIFNWFWDDEAKEQELDRFGFTQIYGNFTPAISNWDERIRKVKITGGAPSSWASTNEFNFGKDLILDYLGCANLLWSMHTIGQLELGGIVREMMRGVRADLSGKRIPSEDGDPVVPVDISQYVNLTSGTEIFKIDLRALTMGEIKSGSMLFNLVNPAGTYGNTLVAVGSEGIDNAPLPSQVNGISINDDVSSLVFLHACARPAANQKAYFNIPDFFDSADLLGWYEIVYEDGYKDIVPIQYGVNILEWNPGGEKSLDTREGDTGSQQNAYCYMADPVKCSVDGKKEPVTFFAFEWVNPRFGKVIREVNLHGSAKYQSLQQDYGKVVTAPMPGNAVILAGISKVTKREPFIPR